MSQSNKGGIMKRIAIAICALAALAATLATTAVDAKSQAARTLCVGSKPACYSTIQGAVDAAHDGDTIAIAQGRYAGGVASRGNA
jgi:pectin methylesterase-like acyl-CoA thioesterase